jgi:hypothetical protein
MKYGYVVKDHIPYRAYAGLKEKGVYVIHPMALGAYGFRSAGSQEGDEVLEAAWKIGVPLPNAGMAWYYPKHYANSRMLGPDICYSAISQSQILSGFLKIRMQHPSPETIPVQKVFKAFLYPYKAGGISLFDVALLEWPLFRSAPEIVLNGWLKALLDISDYYKVTGDPEAKNLLKRNLQFLAKVLHHFDVPDRHLSRYSDLCPYRILIRFQSSKEPSFRVRYESRFPEILSMEVPIEVLDNPGKYSIYDNQILRRRPHDLLATISLSRLFATVLTSDADAFTVEMRAGVYDGKKIMPGHTGKKLLMESESCAGGSRIDFNGVRKDLIIGYPTNFAKGGRKNTYHVHHVVALLYLARSSEMKASIRRALIRWALRWSAYMERATVPKGCAFEDPQIVLKGINYAKVIVTVTSFAELISWARAFDSHGTSGNGPR